MTKHILIEFLDSSETDNIISCLRFVFEKVVFFGSIEAIEKHKKRLEKFLQSSCNVKETEFCSISLADFNQSIQIMRQTVQREILQGHEIFGDITGGEDLALVALGYLSHEMNFPLHRFNVIRNKLIELPIDGQRTLSACVPRQNLKLSLAQFIELQGGRINSKLHKDFKEKLTPAFKFLVEEIWEITRKHKKVWTAFSSVMGALFHTNNTGLAQCSVNSLVKAIEGTRVQTMRRFMTILSELQKIGAIDSFKQIGQTYQLAYKNDCIESCICDPGSILEIHTFLSVREQFDDCCIGVHIDWDGVIHESGDTPDVLNEIDVMGITQCVPTFISCKNGNLTKNEALQAIYELDSVARRLGDRYAKKVLVLNMSLGKTSRLRAQELGIEIR